MSRIKAVFMYFTRGELLLWCLSVVLIIVSFAVFDREGYLVLTASVIGVTSLIFNAKGNPFGQFLMIIFSVLYGIISFTFAYYGEMITYLGMTLPSAIVAMVNWLRHPYDEREVEVNVLSKKNWLFLIVSSIIVTVALGYILHIFGTTNMLFSTVSITTSYFASMLTIMRSQYYAVAYALNDIVLIILWTLATIVNINYLPMIICFIIFLVNDLYGFMNWKIMKNRQKAL